MAMKKNFFLAMACAVVILSSCSSGQPAGKISAWKAKHVFLIGIDGWGSYSMKQAKVPNIRDLMANGSYTLEKRSVLPSSQVRSCMVIVNGVRKCPICRRE